jgi:hypothetical protein
MKRRSHNPERVNSRFIPKGYRLLRSEEFTGEPLALTCHYWLPGSKRFYLHAPADGNISSFTYITPKLP